MPRLLDIAVRALLIVLLLAGFCAPAWALPQCGPRGEFVKNLYDEFLERRQAMGLTGAAGLVELFVSAQGTWTILISRPGGLTCMIAAGHGWEADPQPLHVPTAATELP